MSEAVQSGHDEARALSFRDGRYVARLLPLLRTVVRTWFRSEVEGIEHIPDGGALIVSNHSGGLIAMDVPIIAVAFHDHFGADRPLYVLAHDMLFLGSSGPAMRRAGFLPATRENAHAVLSSGGVTIVFPGGDYDVFRPTSKSHVVDFAGRTGYVRTALRAGVPIVPVVSSGGQEGQLHLHRGELLARWLRLEKLLRTRYLPVTFGVPFGLTFGFPPNLPLPTKIRTRVLEPVDPAEVVGDLPADADIEKVDRMVRARMQSALDDLRRRRRLPVLG